MPENRPTAPQYSIPWNLLAGVVVVLIGVLAAVIAGLTDLAILLVLSALVFSLAVIRHARQPEMYCPQCGMVGTPASAAKGSWIVQLVLLACLIVPGLIYWAWRFGPRQQICAHCRQSGLIPANSPRALEMRKRQQGPS